MHPIGPVMNRTVTAHLSRLNWALYRLLSMEPFRTSRRMRTEMTQMNQKETKCAHNMIAVLVIEERGITKSIFKQIICRQFNPVVDENL